MNEQALKIKERIEFIKSELKRIGIGANAHDLIKELIEIVSDDDDLFKVPGELKDKKPQGQFEQIDIWSNMECKEFDCSDMGGFI